MFPLTVEFTSHGRRARGWLWSGWEVIFRGTQERMDDEEVRGLRAELITTCGCSRNSRRRLGRGGVDRLGDMVLGDG